LVGLSLLIALLAFVAIGHAVVDLDKARPLSGPPLLALRPACRSAADKQGRNLLAVMVVGTPQTIEIGIFAGLIGVSVGTLLRLFRRSTVAPPTRSYAELSMLA